jgi:hypothetical protein
MTGITIANLSIRWILDVTAGVAGDHLFHTFQVLEDGLNTPKAAAAQGGLL